MLVDIVLDTAFKTTPVQRLVCEGCLVRHFPQPFRTHGLNAVDIPFPIRKRFKNKYFRCRQTGGMHDGLKLQRGRRHAAGNQTPLSIVGSHSHAIFTDGDRRVSCGSRLNTRELKRHLDVRLVMLLFRKSTPLRC